MSEHMNDLNDILQQEIARELLLEKIQTYQILLLILFGVLAEVIPGTVLYYLIF